MTLIELIALGTSGLALMLSAVAIWLDVRILRHNEHHHGLLRELHEHHIGQYREDDR